MIKSFTVILLALMHAIVCSGQSLDVSKDPILEPFLATAKKIDLDYTLDLVAKRQVVVNRADGSLQPVLDFLDSEIAFTKGDHSKPRILLSTEDGKSLSVKKANLAMFQALLAGQNSHRAQVRKNVEDFKAMAVKQKLNEARTKLCLVALGSESTSSEELSAGFGDLIAEVKSLKVPQSRLVHKDSEVYFIRVVDGHVGLSASEVQKLITAKFPEVHATIMGPADVGGSLSDFQKYVGNKLEAEKRRCIILAGWNMNTSTLMLPKEGEPDFTFEEVASSEKADELLVGIYPGSAKPGEPNFLVFTPEAPNGRPYFPKDRAFKVSGIVAIVRPKS